jgi:hypothetical protein
MNARENAAGLDAERIAVETTWRATQSIHVPLALAASFALFELATGEHRDSAVQSFDYVSALNLVAAALASSVTLYARQGSAQDPVAVPFNPASQRFEGGAKALRSPDGILITDILVRRADVLAAIPALERARLPFVFPFRAKGATR